MVIGVLIAQDNYALESIIEYATYIGISGQLLNDASDVIRLDDKSDVKIKIDVSRFIFIKSSKSKPYYCKILL